MKEILETIGIDVHKNTYSICAFNSEKQCFEHEMVLNAEAKMVIKYMEKLKKEMISDSVQFLIGYEAGPTGFGLKRTLTAHGFDCKIMAPTTIIYGELGGRKIKTDRLDARNIAKALYWGAFKEVVPLFQAQVNNKSRFIPFCVHLSAVAYTC